MSAAAWSQPARAALGLFVAYLAVAAGSMALSRQSGGVATLWYANAVAIAVLLRRPPVQWPLPVLATALAVVGVNLLFGDAPRLALAFVPANLAEVLFGAWALRRAGLERSALRSPSAVLLLLALGGVAAPLVGAALGAATIAWLQGAPYAAVWLQWFEGAAIGAISMLPLALLVLATPRAALVAALLDWRVLAFAPLTVAVTLLSLIHLPFPFVALSLPLLWAAMSLPMLATALLTQLTSVTVAVAFAQRVFLPPPVVDEAQQALVYLALAGALVPPLLLAAAAAALGDSHARLSARERELSSANEALEQFVHLVSHELREPLNTIAQFGGLVAQDHGERLPADGRRYLALVNEGAARLRRLLDEVLQFARLRAGALGGEDRVALDDVLEQARQALAARIAATGAQLAIDPLPVVRGKAETLSLLFQNLLLDALSAVPEDRVPRVRVTAGTAGDRILVTVADNGGGPAAGPSPPLHEATGPDLALALARRIAQAHGGELQQQDLPGVGRAVSVTLRAAPG